MMKPEEVAWPMSSMTAQQQKLEPMKSNDPSFVFDCQDNLEFSLKSTMQVVEGIIRNEEDVMPSPPRDDVTIDIELDDDTDRDVDDDPIDTSDMGRGGDVTMQGIENGIGNDGRTYIEAQSSVVTLVLRAKASGGQFSHYRVLDRSDHKADNSGIEWAYQMLASRVHP